MVGQAVVAVVAAGGSAQQWPWQSRERRAARGRRHGIVDGDTLDVRVSGREERIRLLNIDTPEVGDCLADEATAFLAGRVPVGSTVRLEYDDVRLDRYGRTLAGVFAGDDLVNAAIARAGLGAPVVFDDNDRFLPPVEQAAAAASADGIGLHSAVDAPCTVPALAAALDRTVAGNPTLPPPDGPASADLVAAMGAPGTVLGAANALLDRSGSSGGDAGYTGPRCYAPGGQTWRPC